MIPLLRDGKDDGIDDRGLFPAAIQIGALQNEGVQFLLTPPPKWH